MVVFLRFDLHSFFCKPIISFRYSSQGGRRPRRMVIRRECRFSGARRASVLASMQRASLRLSQDAAAWSASLMAMFEDGAFDIYEHVRVAVEEDEMLDTYEHRQLAVERDEPFVVTLSPRFDAQEESSFIVGQADCLDTGHYHVQDEGPREEEGLVVEGENEEYNDDAVRLIRTLHLGDIPFWQADAMPPHIIFDTLALISELFEHIPHAVCGHAALVMYGWNLLDLTHISLVCSPIALDLALYWATAQGLHRDPHDPNVLWLPAASRSAPSRARQIRLYTTRRDEDFHHLDIVTLRETRTALLTLPLLADNIARGYTRCLRDSDSPAAEARAKKAAFARDMRWVLRRIAQLACPLQWLTVERAPRVASREFLLPFMACFPDTEALFVRAGLRAPQGGMYSQRELDWVFWSLMELGCEEEEEERNSGGDAVIAERGCGCGHAAQGEAVGSVRLEILRREWEFW